MNTTETSISKTPSATGATDLLELLEWCQRYDATTRYPSTTMERFAIAFYQIGQALKYPVTSMNHKEGWAACLIHLLIVSERCKCPIETQIDVSHRGLSWEREVLLAFSNAQRMLWYRELSIRTHAVKRERASRFKLPELTKDLSFLIQWCISRCGHQLSEALFNATRIMTEKL